MRRRASAAFMFMRAGVLGENRKQLRKLPSTEFSILRSRNHRAVDNEHMPWSLGTPKKAFTSSVDGDRHRARIGCVGDHHDRGGHFTKHLVAEWSHGAVFNAIDTSDHRFDLLRTDFFVSDVH